jgi:hypothetical protein
MSLLVYAGILLALGMGFFGWCLCVIAAIADADLETDPFDDREAIR